MGYDRGDIFPFDFEPNGFSFGSENRKENCHHDHIPFNVKGNGNIVFSMQVNMRRIHKHAATEFAVHGTRQKIDVAIFHRDRTIRPRITH